MRAELRSGCGMHRMKSMKVDEPLQEKCLVLKRLIERLNIFFLCFRLSGYTGDKNVSLVNMEFKDTINYLEFWERGFEGVDDYVDCEDESPVCSGFSKFDLESKSSILPDPNIRAPSPDIFADSSDEEALDFDTKQAAILNQVHVMMNGEQDEVKLFILDSIRRLLSTSSSCTSRELFYKCPVNIKIELFYMKVSLFL